MGTEPREWRGELPERRNVVGRDNLVTGNTGVDRGTIGRLGSLRTRSECTDTLESTFGCRVSVRHLGCGLAPVGRQASGRSARSIEGEGMADQQRRVSGLLSTRDVVTRGVLVLALITLALVLLLAARFA